MSSHVISRKLVERTVGGKLLSIETGFLAKQASGSVVVRIGDTMTLVALVAAPGREGLDFFPLSVDYREKTYSAGKFPGGFIKREGRPTTKEILTSRLIDRPIRPLFPESYRDEVQIQAGPISADRQNDADVPSMIGASAALLLARVPFLGPVGSIRLGRIDGKLVAFPTAQEMESSDLDLIVSSTDKAVVMIEGFGEELPEAEMAEAIMEAHRLNQELIALQKRAGRGRRLAPARAPSGRRSTRCARRFTSVRRAASRDQADRHEGRAQRGHQGAREHGHQRADSGRASCRAPAGPSDRAGTHGDPAPSPVPADPWSRRRESRRPLARSKSGSSAS